MDNSCLVFAERQRGFELTAIKAEDGSGFGMFYPSVLGNPQREFAARGPGQEGKWKKPDF
jgi:hypothetical protein